MFSRVFHARRVYWHPKGTGAIVIFDGTGTIAVPAIVLASRSDTVLFVTTLLGGTLSY